MKPEKPSRNEDEYFAREDAELLRKQRERETAATLDAERKSHFRKWPKDGDDLASGGYHGVTRESCAHGGGRWLGGGGLGGLGGGRQCRHGHLGLAATAAPRRRRSSRS